MKQSLFTLGLLLVLAGAVGLTATEARLPSLFALGAGLALAGGAGAALIVGLSPDPEGRATLWSIGAVFHGLLLVGIAVAVNVLVARHPVQWDLTGNGRFTLSPETVRVLARLPDEVQVTAFVADQDGLKTPLADLLGQYQTLAPRLRVTWADINKKPDLASHLKVTGDRTTVIQCGERSERLSGLPDETALTNALLRVTRTAKTRVLFVEGHGERNLAGSGHAGLAKLATLLGESGFVCEPRNLRAGKLPTTDLVALVGPSLDLLATEEAALVDFVDGGGGLLVALDPAPGVGLPNLLAAFGVQSTDAVLVDRTAAEVTDNPLIPLVIPNPSHPIGGDANAVAAFPLARPVRCPGNPGYRGEPFLETGRESFAELDFNRQKIRYDEGRDLPGPLPFGVAVEAVRSGTAEVRAAGRVVVIGDSDFLTNGTLFYQGTYLLAKNAFAWLERRSELSALDARPWIRNSIRLGTREKWLLFWIVIVLLPSMLAFAGLFVYLRGFKSPKGGG